MSDHAAEARRQATEAELQLATMRGHRSLKGDPLAEVLGLLVAVVRVFPPALDAMQEARHPLTSEEGAKVVADIVKATERGAQVGAAREARSLGRRIDRRTAAWMGAAVGLAFLAGGAVVAALAVYTDTGALGRTARAASAWDALIRDNPDPRPAIAASGVRQDASGRKYYPGLPMWAEPAPLPR